MKEGDINKAGVKAYDMFRGSWHDVMGKKMECAISLFSPLLLSGVIMGFSFQTHLLKLFYRSQLKLKKESDRLFCEKEPNCATFTLVI